MKVKGIILMSLLLWANQSSAQIIRKLTQANVALTESNSISQCESLDSDISIRNIYIEKNNLKYLATKNQGVYKLKDCSSEINNILQKEQSYFITQDQKKNLWVATSGNKLINITQDKVIDLPNVSGEAFINFIHFSQNYIWVGTLTDGLILLDNLGNKLVTEDKLAKIVTEKLNAICSEVYDIFIDKDDNTWLATGDGLFKLSALYEQGEFLNVAEKKAIKSITGDQNYLWFSSLTGLWQLELSNNQVSEIKLKQNIGVIEDLIFDYNQQLWVAGDVIAHYAIKADSSPIHLKIFDHKEGFKSRKATCLAVDKNNAIWVGTSGGGVYKIHNESPNMVNIDYIQSFELTAGGLLNATESAQKVNVLQVSYLFNDNLSTSEVSTLDFVLRSDTGNMIPLSEVGYPENYNNRSFIRNLKIADDFTLSPGNYTLEIKIDQKEAGKFNYELY